MTFETPASAATCSIDVAAKPLVKKDSAAAAMIASRFAVTIGRPGFFELSLDKVNGPVQLNAIVH